MITQRERGGGEDKRERNTVKTYATHSAISLLLLLLFSAVHDAVKYSSLIIEQSQLLIEQSFFKMRENVSECVLRPSFFHTPFSTFLLF